jgi:hypothetical protein
MSALKARFIHHVGTRHFLGRSWYSRVGEGPFAHEGRHWGTVLLATTAIPNDPCDTYSLSQYAADNPVWAIKCNQCDAVPPEDADRSSKWSSKLPQYDTPSGEAEAGDLYWVDEKCAEEGYCPHGWTNCDGKHLNGVTPDLWHWDMMSRASNCTLREDTLHRCWVVHNNDGVIHVDKAGLTCQAGAGSIVSPKGWHGFLHNGQWDVC